MSDVGFKTGGSCLWLFQKDDDALGQFKADTGLYIL